MSSFLILTSFSTSENKAFLTESLFKDKSQEQKHLQSYLSRYQFWSHSQCNWEQEHGEAVQSSWYARNPSWNVENEYVTQGWNLCLPE